MTSGQYAGGIVGRGQGIRYCFVTGNITATATKIDNAWAEPIATGTSVREGTYWYDGVVLVKNGVVSDNTKISKCTAEQLSSASFYTDNLKWKTDIWDLSELDFKNGKLPKLIKKK